MRYISTMLVVKDLEQSKAFYKKHLGQEVITDFGANVTLTGGFALQTLESWIGFIGEPSIEFKGKNMELYFETDDYDDFIANLEDLDTLHPPIEHPWGQRGVRFYDPDGHIIEVGETLTAVAKRFKESELTVAEIAVRMGVKEEYVLSWLS